MFERLFPPGIVVEVGTPRWCEDELFPEEVAHVRNAVPKRRAEFATARVCARRALQALGLPPVALVPDAQRAPRWPEGVVGSISHSDEVCAVAIGRAPPFTTLGLDVERLRPLDVELRRMILTPRELRWLHDQPPAQQNALAVLCFSAKEAYYKGQYVLTRTLLDFHDVELAIDLERRCFQAALLLRAGVPNALARADGRFCFSGEHVATALAR
jgi:4'-phosphopantetheinyl transferase EntD